MNPIVDKVAQETTLWAGQNNEQYYGDDPLRYTTKPVQTNAQIKNALTQAQYEKILAQYAQQQNTAVNTTATATGFDLSSFIADNKWLLLGGAALLTFFMFNSSGGNLAEQTIVRRYATRK